MNKAQYENQMLTQAYICIKHIIDICPQPSSLYERINLLHKGFMEDEARKAIFKKTTNDLQIERDDLEECNKLLAKENALLEEELDFAKKMHNALEQFDSYEKYKTFLTMKVLEKMQYRKLQGYEENDVFN